MAVALISDIPLSWGALEWEKDPPAAQWDHALATLGGHPLQSCLWGDARRDIDGIAQHCWLARRDGAPVWMIRVEERKILTGKVAWAPRGPSGRTTEFSRSVPPGFDARLRAEGFSLLVTDPWIAIDDGRVTAARGAGHAKPQTIWIDLSLGKDFVFKRLHKHVRNGIRRAAKAGISIETTANPAQIEEFAELCRSISAQKGFELRLTATFINAILQRSGNGKDVEAVLFIALKNGKLGTGLFILRVGRSVHLIGAGTNRELRQERVGEACEWGVIEWAIACGCRRYDLEGIDPINNPSVYEFKKRLGGDEITLHGHAHRPLNFSGRVMSRLIRFRSNG